LAGEVVASPVNGELRTRNGNWGGFEHEHDDEDEHD
jgi:hypothetical protein